MRIERLTVAWRSLGEVPVWFVVVAVLAGVVVAVAVAVVGADRRPEALAAVVAGVLAAGAAVPDTEVVALLVVVGAIAAIAVAVAPSVPTRWWPLVAAATGLAMTWALVDGGRGRPGTVLLAPVLVAPVAATARWPGSPALILVALRLAVGFGIGVAVARLTGLGDGTLLPALGGLVGAGVVATGLRTIAARRPT